MRKMTAAALLALGLLVGGCSNGGGAGMFEKDKDYALKVLYTDRESFMDNYGYYIQAEYPNVELQVVPVSGLFRGSFDQIKQGLLDIVQKEQPDLLFLQSWQMSMMQEEEQLRPLDHLLSAETIRNLHPGVKQMLEREGDGKLYSISTSFIAEAVYYNKSLFDQYGIPVPTEESDWLELLELASRFQGDDAAGLYQPYMDAADLMAMIGFSEGLSYVNHKKDRTTVQLHTDNWANIAERIKAAYGTGSLMLLDEAEQAGGEDWFRKGKAAIMKKDSSYVQELEDANVSFEWGVLPVPSAEPGKMWVMPEYMMAIPKDSSHAEDAAKLINFIQSDKIARLLQNLFGLSSSMTSPIAADGSNRLHFMYERDADTTGLDGVKWAEYLPIEFRDYFHHTVRSIMAGETDVREGLKSIEQFGNEQP